MPVGSIMWFAGSTGPPGWILANGAVYTNGTYPNLFAAIGNTYGGVVGTSFAVPSVASTTGAYYIRYTTAIGVTTTTSLTTAVVGTMMQWPITSSYPTGWLRCDGTSYSTTTYNDLFTLIGYTYGGSGSSFNVPNISGAGAGSPVYIIKATSSGLIEPSTVAHASSHTQGGSDVISVTLNQVPSFQTYRNRIINGSFDVWQRNTSFSLSGVAGAYTADRWAFYMDGTGGAVTVSRQAFTPGTAPVSGYEGTYFARINRTAAGTGTTYSNFQQPIEEVRTFAGQTITVSFWAKADAARSLGVQLTQDFGTGGSAGVSTALNTASITTSWQRFSYTYTLPSIAGKTISATDSKLYLFFGCGNIVSTFDIWGVQVEAGSVATPFEFEPFETTFRKCQRYFSKCTPITQTNFTTQAADSGMQSGTCWIIAGGGGGGVRISFPVEMRAVPTIDITSWTSTNTNVSNGGSITTHSPGIGDITSIMEVKSQTGISIYTTSNNYKMFFFWRANAEL
jgi:microcystin-dependent protein